MKTLSVGRCDECVYWVVSSRNPHEGECRRRPPTLLEGTGRTGLWPITGGDAGCGEYKNHGLSADP